MADRLSAGARRALEAAAVPVRVCPPSTYSVDAAAVITPEQWRASNMRVINAQRRGERAMQAAWAEAVRRGLTLDALADEMGVERAAAARICARFGLRPKRAAKSGGPAGHGSAERRGEAQGSRGLLSGSCEAGERGRGKGSRADRGQAVRHTAAADPVDVEELRPAAEGSRPCPADAPSGSVQPGGPARDTAGDTAVGIAPIERRGLTPAALPAALPELCWVPVGRLIVDRGYQRRIAERGVRLVRRLVEGWDWARVKALTVVARPDGRYEVLDGQHTAAAAATHGAIAALPCLVVAAADRPARARAFVALNRDRVGITQMQIFYADLAAGDAQSVAVARAAEATGVRVLRNPPSRGVFRPGDTVAAHALRAAARRHGQGGLERILRCLAPARPAPLRAVHVQAVAELLFAPEFGLEDGRLAVLLAREPGLARLEQEAAAERLARGGPLSRALAVAVSRRAG